MTEMQAFKEVRISYRLRFEPLRDLGASINVVLKKDFSLIHGRNLFDLLPAFRDGCSTRRFGG